VSVLLPATLVGLAAALLLAPPRVAAARLDAALPPRPAVAPVAASRRKERRRAAGSLPWQPLVAAAAGLAGLVTGGVALGLVLAAGSAVAAQAARARAAATAARSERRAAVEACGVLRGELRAGRTPAEALQSAADAATGGFRSRLAAAASATRLGGDVGHALSTGPATSVSDVAAALAACWRVCAGAGSGLAAAVERLEEALRADEEARRAVEQELAGPRATAGLLALLPLAGIALAAALGAHPLRVLLETRVGNICLVGGVALDLAGLAWTRLLARAAVSGA
jgi:tight adherence protein B